MAEPTSSTVITGAIIYKILVYFFGPLLASVVVLIMTPPPSRKEAVVGIISTLICSIAGGAYIVTRIFGIQDIDSELTAMFVGGIFFVSGLPGWFAVRAMFYAMEQNQNRSIVDIVNEIRGRK
ncbi:hypothetical protein ACTXL1_06995 [Psychrobacter celer]|uniref:hypothetical protein n=1 Tax=Psychrobacter celer TaxID=306572 RepID=UPI003FD695AC